MKDQGIEKDGSDHINIDDFQSNFNSGRLNHLFATFSVELTFGLILFIINTKELRLMQQFKTKPYRRTPLI